MNKSNGLADCVGTETVYEVAHWFDKRFKGECRVPLAWTILRLVFSRSLTPSSECSQEWFTTVLVD